MLVLRRGALWFLGITGGSAILAAAITGYRLMSAGGLVVTGELFLFWGIITLLLFLAFFMVTLVRSQSLDRRLDRLIDQGNRRDIVPGRDFQTLGKLGERLTTIFNQISRQNLMKGRKISAMTDLVEFLVRNSERPLAACDVMGTVQYVSETLDDFLELDRVEVIQKKIQNIVPQIPFSDIRAAMVLDRQPKTEKFNSTEFTCYPIEDRIGELAYMVFLFNSKARFFTGREKSNPVSSNRTRIIAAGMARVRQFTKR